MVEENPIVSMLAHVQNVHRVGATFLTQSVNNGLIHFEVSHSDRKFGKEDV